MIIKNQGAMFDFITSTVNPIGGCSSGGYYDDPGYKHCNWNCVYCWSGFLKEVRRRFPKYEGPWRIYPHTMKKYSPKDFIFPFDMIDIGDPTLPEDIILYILEWIAEQPCQVLLLTKNPSFYRDYAAHIPPNAVLGATIECDIPVVLGKVSNAPSPLERLQDMMWVKNNLPNDRLICVEPIMPFSVAFAGRISWIDPSIIAVGYDSGRNGLLEPSLENTKDFIAHLDELLPSAEIYVKLMRPAWVAVAPLTDFMKVKVAPP